MRTLTLDDDDEETANDEATLECNRLTQELHEKESIGNTVVFKYTYIIVLLDFIEVELREKLETSNRMSRKMSLEIDLLKSALKRSSSVRDIEETILDDDNQEIELKDVAIQVNILQLNCQKVNTIYSQ